MAKTKTLMNAYVPYEAFGKGLSTINMGNTRTPTAI